MRALVAGLAIAVVAGCGGVAGGAPVPTPIVTSPAASAARQTSARPSPEPSASAVAWRLPVATSSGGDTATAGFISLPGGTFSEDPQGDLANNSVGTPPLKGTWPRTNFAMFPTYDLPQHRWVPVSAEQLAPDGGEYAYAEWVMPTGPVNGPTPPAGIRIHVVDVAAAVDRVVYSTSKQLLSVVAFSADGIYVTNQCWEGCGGVGGMWLLNPSTGAIKTILSADADHTDWRWISNGMAWGMGPWDIEGGGDKVFRLDISTGSVLLWTIPNSTSYLVGVDSRGFPLVETQDPSSGAVELWDQESSTSGNRIFASPTVVHFSAPFSGPCGTWIGSDRGGLYQLASSDALEPVATNLVAQSNGLVVAGPCVPI